MPRLLRPSEFDALRKQFGATPQNFNTYFQRDKGGNIFLKDNYDPTKTPQTSDSVDQNTQLWQMLNGGQLGDNPYLPYLKPRVIEEGGKKFLRIPKNQQLVDLAKFFDERSSTQYKNSSSFVNDYLDWQNSQSKLALDTAQTKYNINRPYYKPTSTNPNSPSVTSKSRANAYDAQGKLIGYAIWNPKTAKTEYTNLEGNQNLDPTKIARVGAAPSSTATTDPNLRADLVSDIQAGHPLSELYGAYPELSASEIKAIYDNTGQ